MTSPRQPGVGSRSISTGSMEIDRRLGGGIPYGTLMFIEGEAASGKSTLSQQLLWGALTSGEDAAIYTTEQTVHSLLRQAESLGLEVNDYFLMNHLQIFPITIPPDTVDAGILFQELSNHMGNQNGCRVMVIDSLTTYVSRAGGDQIQNFFNRCKTLCDSGKVIICTAHTEAFDEAVLTRVRSVCDGYLRQVWGFASEDGRSSQDKGSGTEHRQHRGVPGGARLRHQDRSHIQGQGIDPTR